MPHLEILVQSPSYKGLNVDSSCAGVTSLCSQTLNHDMYT